LKLWTLEEKKEIDRIW